MDVLSKVFQHLMLTSIYNIFQLNNFHIILELASKQLFAPENFPLGYHYFQL